MTEETKPSQVLGCAFGLLRLTVTLPLWYIILYAILSRIDTPTGIWVAFWVYVPTGLMLALAEEGVKQLFRAGK